MVTKSDIIRKEGRGNMTAGEKLKQLRGHRTIKEVALATGITERSLYAYEQEYRTPSDERKIILSRYYGTSVASIFFLPEDATNSDNIY